MICAALVACGGQESARLTDSVAPSGDTATAGCSAVERVAIQGGGHLIGDQEPPVPYSSVPPTSGWHASGEAEIAVHGVDDVLDEPGQVKVLEVGGTVVTHHGLADQELDTLEEAVRQGYADRVAVTPYPALAQGEVAFSAWGAVQRCDALDLDALDTFAGTYSADGIDQPDGH